MKAKFTFIIPVLLVGIILNSCKKEEGQGGRASIRGKIYVKNYTAAPCPCYLKDQYYAQAENVYITYSTQIGVSDNVKTSDDGSFEFPYLRKGTYTVYALSKDTSSIAASKTIAVKTIVEITEKKQIIDVQTLTILK